MREFIFGVALISATLISIFFLPQILNTLLAFLTPKKEECFNRVEPWRSGSMQQWNCEKLEVTRFLGLTPFVRLRKEPRTKFPFRILRLIVVPVVTISFVSLCTSR